MARRGSYLALSIMLATVACGSPAPVSPPTGEPTPLPAESPPASVATPTAGSPTEPGQATAAATPQPSPPAATPGPTATAGLLAGALAWRELEPESGPGPREDHTWTVDAAGRGAYLFGGRQGRQAFDELWRYDLDRDSWQLLEPVGDRPEPRFGHVAVWVDGIGLVVWSGQQSARVFFGDIWAFDADAGRWQRLADGGDVPEARYGSCGGIGPDGRLWISHGFTEDTGRFFDTRAYDFDAQAWTDLTPAGDVPVLRCLHRCLWTPDGRFVLYAGQTTGAPAIGDLWSLDPGRGKWSQADDPPAAARQLYSVAQVDDTAVVFGGGASDGALLDDLWLLDLRSLDMRSAEVLSGGPAGRFGAALISDAARGRLLLFGGKSEAGEVSDLWELSPAGR
jgi:hypothetical protein